MKKILHYFFQFHREYFTLKVYIPFLLFVAALIAFNYSLDFEDSYIDQYRGKAIRGVFFFLYHAMAYYGTLFFIALATGRKFTSREFWIKSTLILAILAFDRSFYAFTPILKSVPRELYVFTYKCLNNAKGILTVVLPSIFLFMAFDKKEGNGFYGLKFKNVNFKPYWTMLLLMAPILFLASFNEDISTYYPTYKRAKGGFFAAYFDVPQFVSIVVFESIYLVNFIFTELLFRGLFIVGLVKLLGKDCILPMVAAYAVLHFGKPLPETIGSVFGGYILGIITYYSKNIWGGVFIHMGIAFLMEFFAFL